MKSKRILSLVLAMIMVLGTFGTVFADTAVTEEVVTNGEKIDWLVDQGMVKGNENNDLMLDKEIDRASTARMIAVALDLEVEAEGLKGINSGFKDMTTAHWANGYANLAAGKSLIVGDENGNFMPAKDITYGEVAAILVRLSLGRDLTAAERGTAGSWVAPYVSKASELGILDGVSVIDFNGKAVRRDVLEMFYNAMINMEVGNYSVVKAIVLENNRVEAIGSDEVVVEVIKQVQVANYAGASRLEKGNQEKFTIEAKVGDVENLLGKVVDLTLNKDNKVVKVAIDTTYEYVQGTLSATKNRVRVGGRTYTVELDERYKDSDERIFRTYQNDNAYAYEDFYQDVNTMNSRQRATSFDADFAKATIKNGKVLFIDAFNFKDIAPVQEARRDYKDIYVYNDERDARIEKFEPAPLVIGFNDGVFSRITREDIRTNDVVHVYGPNSDRMIVRQDAAVIGEYIKVERKFTDNTYYVHVDENSYKINDSSYRRPVYAHDSKAYATLLARDAQSELAKFYKEKVTILKDINNELQLFGAEMEFNEGMTLVDQILARGQGRFVQSTPKADLLQLDEDYKSAISFADLATGNMTTNRRLIEFDRGDLTFTQGNEGIIDQLVRIEKFAAIKTKSINVNQANINSGYIAEEANLANRFQVIGRTNVFVIDEDKGNVTRMYGSTTAEVAAFAVANSTMQAYVLSDYDVNELVRRDIITDRNRVTTRPDLAHTIVFTNVDYKGSSYDSEIVHVSNVYTATRPHSVVGNTADNKGKERVDRLGVAQNLLNVKVDDIVQLGLTKNDDKNVAEVKVLIASNKVNTESYKVVAMDSKDGHRRLYIEDGAGVRSYRWLTPGFHEFGTITVNSVITFHEANTAGDLDVIRVYREGTAVTANRPVAPVYSYPRLATAYQELNKDIIVRIETLDANNRVVTTNYRYVGAQKLAELISLTGKHIAYPNFTMIGNETVVLEIKEYVTSVDQVKANEVMAKITDLPANVELVNKVEVEAARVAYDALTPAQRALVTNYSVLVAAEAKIADLEQVNPEEVTWVEDAKSIAAGFAIGGKLNVPAGKVVTVKATVGETTVDGTVNADGTFVINTSDLGSLKMVKVRVFVDGVEVVGLVQEVLQV